MSDESQSVESQPESTEPEIQSQEVATETEAPQTEAQHVQSLLKKFKLKVDGEEIEEEIDLADEERLVRELQLAKAAKKRMAEAQEAKRKAYEIAQAFEQDPASILRRLGDKGYEYAEQVLLEKLQREMMTPEQRQLAEMKAKLEQYEKMEAEQKRQQELAQQQALEAKIAQEYQQKIISALDKSGLPKTPEMAKRMAYLLQKNMELGLDLDAEDLAQEAKNEVMGLIGSLSKDADAEKLLALIGKENLKKIDKHRVQQLKQKQIGGSPSKPLTQGSLPRRGEQKRQMTWEEWQEETEKRIKSLK